MVFGLDHSVFISRVNDRADAVEVARVASIQITRHAA
jgi:hypothetical protein